MADTALDVAIKEAELAQLLADTRKADAEATAAEIRLQQQKETDQQARAGDYHRRIYNFYGYVDEMSVSSCIDTLTRWSRMDGVDRPTTFTVVFNPPGGSVLDGFALWDTIKGLQNDGFTVNTGARGYAASMAGILLQAGDERFMGRQASLLIHEISTGAIGKISSIEDELKLTRKLTERTLDIFAERSNLDREEIRSRMDRHDWWLSSSEALELGFVDRLVG